MAVTSAHAPLPARVLQAAEGRALNALAGLYGHTRGLPSTEAILVMTEAIAEVLYAWLADSDDPRRSAAMSPPPAPQGRPP